MNIKSGDINSGDIKKAVRQFIAENVLLGVHQTTIDDTMPLVTGGLIDSIGMIGLVAFLENRFEVEFMPREIDVHSLDTLERIEEVVRKKLAGGGATFANKGRTISILPQGIGDRALVIYTDLPDAMGSNVFDPAAITLGK